MIFIELLSLYAMWSGGSTPIIPCCLQIRWCLLLRTADSLDADELKKRLHFACFTPRRRRSDGILSGLWRGGSSVPSKPRSDDRPGLGGRRDPAHEGEWGLTQQPTCLELLVAPLWHNLLDNSRPLPWKYLQPRWGSEVA